ncbi:unnamed protein product [Caenorhabditis brenneri]
MSALKMSMFHVFTHSFTLWSEAYDCPLDMMDFEMERPELGSLFLASGVFFVSLYIPCLIAIIKKMPKAPVYQIMFALAIFDILSLSVNSICTGLFDIFGITFCHYPLPIFCLGAIAGGSWMAGSALLYVYMQFFPVTPELIIISQFVWQWSSGAVCLTYLIFNRTIRNLVLKMTIPRKVRKKLGLHVGIDEHLALEEAVGTVTGNLVGINAIGVKVRFDNWMCN